MDKIKQLNEMQRQGTKTNQIKKNPFSSQVKKQEFKPTSILKNKNIQNNIINKPKISNNIEQATNIITEGSKELIGNTQKIENGDKNIQKKFNKRGSIRSLRKTSNSFSEKNLPIMGFNNLNNINKEMAQMPA